MGGALVLLTAALKPTGPPSLLAKVDFNQLQKIRHFFSLVSICSILVLSKSAKQHCLFLTMWIPHPHQMMHPVGPAAGRKARRMKKEPGHVFSSCRNCSHLLLHLVGCLMLHILKTLIQNLRIVLLLKSRVSYCEGRG